MNDWFDMLAPIIGRILIGGFFLFSGIEKVFNFPSFVELFARANYPQPILIALCIMAIESLGGLALIADYQTRACALVLAVYLILSATVTFQPSTTTTVQLFLQNMAILGGLFMVAGCIPKLKRSR